MEAVPFLLTTLRLLLAPLLLLNAFGSASRAGFVAMLAAGFLSDIFDGVLARHLGVATPWLRRYDSGTDIVFYLGVFGSILHLHPGEIVARVWGIGMVVGLEIACIATSLIRFGAMPAIHTWMAKAWGIVLFAASCACLAGSSSNRWIWLDVVVGMGWLVDLEELTILLSASRVPIDVPSLFLRRRYRDRL